MQELNGNEAEEVSQVSRARKTLHYITIYAKPFWYLRLTSAKYYFPCKATALGCAAAGWHLRVGS